jgi:trimethylamine--corrinoid protein Co-methyltransferase
LARRYGLPCRGNGGLTNAHAPDAQAAYEALWSLWPAVQAHTNLIAHAAGWSDGGLTASYEKFVFDLENLAMFHHFLAGFSVDADTLALETIAAVGPGGHNLGTAHTQARFEHAFFAPTLAERRDYASWVEAGREDTALRAHRLWRAMLEAYERPPLDMAVSDALAAYVARRERELVGRNLYE